MPRALIVERNRELRDLFSDVLKTRGYDVHAVESRAQGFDAMDAMPLDLLLLDDPGHERAYRLVWLEGKADMRVELLDLEPDTVREQLDTAVSN